MAKAQAPSNADRGQACAPASYQLSAALRIEAARQRLEAGTPHGEFASRRDQAARKRDERAAERDRDAEARDKELIELLGGDADRGARDPYVATLRSRVTVVCEGAATDRALAREDRERAACDREFAAIERAQAARERRAAGTDELTGARRRGVGLEELDREIDRARRDVTSLVAVFVDVDNLKSVNDVLGHAAGDRLLRNVVSSLKHQLRAYDLVIRIGGDEFLCVLPGVTVDQARARFADLNAELRSASPEGSVSIGVSELHDHETQPDLIDRADHDLLAARTSRRFSRERADELSNRCRS
jgi:diguanylate cyclase (GGDEF)-like protein